MNKREQIEQILIEFFPSYSPFCTTKVLGKILAIFPEPSRKELECIFAIHHQQYPSREKWLEAICDHIMSWSQGKKEKRWCTHMIHEETPSGHWVFADFGGRYITDWNDLWKFCPVCGAKRPDD